MSPRIIYALDQSAVELFSTASRRDRDHLLNTFQSLTHAPYAPGDYVQKTAAGRPLQVKRFGKWMVTYWFDAPVNELRVLDLKRLVP